MIDNPRWDAYVAECEHHGLEPTQKGFKEAVMNLCSEFIRAQMKDGLGLGWTDYFLERMGPYIAEQAACRTETQRDAQEDR